MAARDILKQAAGDNWEIVAAIGIRETYFQNIAEYGSDGKDATNHLGRGVFQIDLGQNPGVTEGQAFDIQFSAHFASDKITADRKNYPADLSNLTPDLALAETIHDYNASPRTHGGTRHQALLGVPGLDSFTTGHNYVSNVLNLINCFQLGSATKGHL